MEGATLDMIKFQIEKDFILNSIELPVKVFKSVNGEGFIKYQLF